MMHQDNLTFRRAAMMIGTRMTDSVYGGDFIITNDVDDENDEDVDVGA